MTPIAIPGLAALAMTLLAARPILAQPTPAGTTTQITVQDQAPIDAPVSDADDVELLTVTFERPGGTLVNVSILWSWRRGESTRRSIAQQIATRLQNALEANELPKEWVTTAGAAVICTNTPKGVGKNTGTPAKPVMSPPNADHNDLHLEVTTTDQNEK